MRTNAKRMIVALGVATTLAALMPSPVSAEEPDIPYFEDITGAEVSVKGDYNPVVGHFTDQLFDDILWYGYGAAKESMWTPCPDCEAGRFTKETLPANLQVTGYYEPIVGDFAGDRLDDIYWLNRDGSADYLWTNNGSGGFSTKRLDMADGFWYPIVLRDSRSGTGKDDILWRPGEPRTAPLWVFPDNGSGAARTVARLTLPRGEPFIGDYDGNGAADILFYGRPAGCRCPEESAATFIDTYWRRSSSQAPGFTATTMNIKGSYLPLVGRFSGQGDGRDDILWLGQDVQYTSVTDRPDSLWEGRTNGGFTATSLTIPSVGGAVVLGHDVADTALVFDQNGTNVWFDTTSGPVLRPIGSQLPYGAYPTIGRFTTPDRADLFYYYPGTKAEHIYHPIF